MSEPITVSVAYAVGSRVTIHAIGHPGIVEEISIGRHGTSYRVAWWWEGKRQSEWVNDTELEAK
jgi:hypothetical protein